MSVIDLFAGPGGWDVAAARIGLHTLGIEWDDAACATRAAAGLWTLQGDVGALDPVAVHAEHFQGPLQGLIASPPCQSFSMAGKGAGRAAMSAYQEAIYAWGEGSTVDTASLDERCGDPRAHLVLEPLRWATALRPRWIALEQVRPVLPLWEATAVALARQGYWTWTGVLSSECFGVAQTRQRAILLASLDRAVDEPPATHQRYVAPRRRRKTQDALFDCPEPDRIVRPEDAHLLPWVSMAEALGWTEGEVGFPRRNDLDQDGYRERDLRDVGHPAFALTEKARSWQRFVSNAQPNATVRDVTEPAPTITGGHDSGERQWQLRAGTNVNDAVRSVDDPAPTLRFGARLNDVSWQYDVRQNGAVPRDTDKPAPTMTAAGLAKGRDQWVNTQPATTVNGDPQISQPGHHDSKTSGAQQANAVRVGVEEAAALQSFPPGYPWQGSRTKVFEQIGNAVPPLLAEAVLRSVI